MRNRTIFSLAFFVLMLTALQSKAQETETTSEQQYQEKPEAPAEQDLRQLKDWVRLQSDKIATTTRSEWPSIKSEFARAANKIESSFSSLSEASKREFLELKTKFNDLESKPLYDEIPLQAEEVKLREKDLLGQYSNTQSIKPNQLANAYLAFIHSVRDKRQGWIPRDWDYAQYVLEKLNSRKATVENQLSTLDEVKIRAWIGEFHTLRAGHEFKENQKAKNAGKSKN